MTASPTPAAPTDSMQRLLREFDQGRPAALARAVSVVENHRPGFEQLLAELHPRLGRARRIGITGPPGAGKSTITTRLITRYRAAGLRVGVIAVDPTSPFSGGALLGDRIRMEEVALDPGVYIRSLATRGSLGGLSAATRVASDVLDAFGFDRILIETVGVGQSELDVAAVADSTVVALVPESGDSIQTLKAGLMEIADVFVVNKSDRPGADRMRNDIETMLGFRAGLALENAGGHHGPQGGPASPGRAAREAAGSATADRWIPPVVRAVAAKDEGTDDILTALDNHFRYLETSGELALRRQRRWREHLYDLAAYRLRERLWRADSIRAFVDVALPGIERGTQSPFAVVDELLRRTADLIRSMGSER